jgi:hypothetical protein
MFRRLALAPLALCLLVAVATKAGERTNVPVRGMYVEARNGDVWTGPCFANADFNLTGKNAVLAWKVQEGSFDNVRLDGLTIVAVLVAHNTLGLEQNGPAKAVLIVDQRADAAQRAALIRLAKRQAGALLSNVGTIQTAAIRLDACECKSNACAELDAGVARIKTRCIDADHDKICGNETAFYPPLSAGVHAVPAATVDHIFRGTGLGLTWSDCDRRGCYVGTFQVSE